MKNDDKIDNNVACPYCSKIITAKTMGLMICEHCESDLRAVVFKGISTKNKDEILILGMEDYKTMRKLDI